MSGLSQRGRSALLRRSARERCNPSSTIITVTLNFLVQREIFPEIHELVRVEEVRPGRNLDP